MEKLIEVKSLSKSYTNFQLQNINFNIGVGKIVGLIGKNGNGKTTLIKCLMNLLDYDGNVSFFGLDMKKKDKEIKEYVGVVFDELPFDEVLNAYNISKMMKSVYRDWSDEVFDQYMYKFGLPWKKCFKAYSKGMKTKLMLAIALSHDARVLILDEPTSGLDPIFRSEILDELKNYVSENERAVLFSTHITSDLEQVADDILYINEGKLIFSGTKEELLLTNINCGESNTIDNAMVELLKRINNESDD